MKLFVPSAFRSPTRFLLLVVFGWLLLTSLVPLPLLSLDAALTQTAWQLPYLLRLPLTLAFVGVTLWQGRAKGTTAPRGIWFGLLWLTVLCCRWNTLAGYEHNGDESQSILAARILGHDPRFWISVDVGTHGPLVSLWQTLLPRVGLSIDYASSRLLGIIMLLVCVSAGFHLLRRVASEPLARALTVPLALAVASLALNDLTGYNGEHPLILLMALAAASGALAFLPPWEPPAASSPRAVPDMRLLLCAGVCAGAMVWVKIQGVPIAAALIMVTALACLRAGEATAKARLTWLSVYCAGIATPTLLILVWTASSRALPFMFRSYFLWNLSYAGRVKNANGLADALTLGGWAARNFLAMSRWVSGFQLACILGFALFAVALWRDRSPAHILPPASRALLAATSVLVAATWFSALKPGNPFEHYLLLPLLPTLLLPLLLWAALLNVPPAPAVSPAPAHRLGRSVLSRRGLFALFAVFVPLALWGFAGGGSGGGGQLIRAGQPQYPPTSALFPLATRMRAVSRPNETVAVWGWNPGLYVAADHLPAVRSTANLREALPLMAMQPYFLDLYVRDIDRQNPVVFVDTFPPADGRSENAPLPPAVPGTMQWFYETMAPDRSPETVRRLNRGFSHEQYPPLATRITARYRLLYTSDQGRLYVRNNRADDAAKRLAAVKD